MTTKFFVSNTEMLKFANDFCLQHVLESYTIKLIRAKSFNGHVSFSVEFFIK